MNNKHSTPKDINDIDGEMNHLFHSLNTRSIDENFFNIIEESDIGSILINIKSDIAQTNKENVKHPVVFWLSNKLQENSINNSELQPLLIVLNYLCNDTSLFLSNFSCDKQISQTIISYCQNTLNSYTLPDDLLSSYARPFYDNIGNLQKNLEGKRLDDFYREISNYYDIITMTTPILIKSSLVILSIYDIMLVDEAISSFDAPLSIYAIFSSLEKSYTLEISIKTNSYITRNISLCYFFNSLDRVTSLSQNESVLLTNVFTNLFIKNDFDIWMNILNEYPCRYEHIQLALGTALARTNSDTAIDLYIQSIKLYPQSVDSENVNSRETVMKCLTEFSLHAPTALRKKTWLLAFNKWESWNFSNQNTNYIFQISKSELDYPVIKHFIESMSETQREEYRNDILKMIWEIDCVWYKSRSDLTTNYYRAISKLQIYHHATNAVENSGNINLSVYYNYTASDYDQMRIL
ncbi:hypothetical protein ACX1IS_12165 [Yersinia enterocolitica]